MPTVNQLCKSNKTRINRPRKGSRSKGLAGCPHRKGVCVKVTTMKPKKPNSAIRKIAKVKLSTFRRITCYIPGIGHDLREYSHVLVRGGYVPDLPGVQYHLVKGKFDFSFRESFDRIQSRSKYGIPRKRGDY
jgi:small subunit ribosomal protein S12